ncbi:hypothetical protein L484_021303 [Morus notabilis]|uniref:Uncharacterized protein n=1 Tax=Morus notabilis TaxID=981085 RepID=W9SWI1_9ROSA|nr:hypothetical protein L484_021303 [Morus notabilis]
MSQSRPVAAAILANLQEFKVVTATRRGGVWFCRVWPPFLLSLVSKHSKILEKSDYTMISGHPFIKKTGWRKISFYFNLSYEIKDKTIEFDDNLNVQRAEFVVRAYMQGGRFSDGWGSCERREKKFFKPNHDIPSTAETRAKNKACQDLLGIGEYRPVSFLSFPSRRCHSPSPSPTSPSPSFAAATADPSFLSTTSVLIDSSTGRRMSYSLFLRQIRSFSLSLLCSSTAPTTHPSSPLHPSSSTAPPPLEDGDRR